MYVLVLSPGAWGRALTKAVVNGMMAFRERQERGGRRETEGKRAWRQTYLSHVRPESDLRDFWQVDRLQTSSCVIA